MQMYRPLKKWKDQLTWNCNSKQFQCSMRMLHTVYVLPKGNPGFALYAGKAYGSAGFTKFDKAIH